MSSNHPSPRRLPEKQDGGQAGIAFVILIVIVVVAYLLLRNGCNPS